MEHLHLRKLRQKSAKDVIPNDMFFNENIKCRDAEINRTRNENKVQNALDQQKKDLTHWRKELDLAVDRLGNERLNLQRCLGTIERNHNHVSCLLDAVKQCQQLRRTKNGLKIGHQGDSTDKALTDECVLLLSCCQSYVSLGKDVGDILRDLRNIEVNLTIDLENKVASTKTSLDCQYMQLSPVCDTEPNRNDQPEQLPNKITIGSENKQVWEDSISQHLEQAAQLVSRSSNFRVMVKDRCTSNCVKIKASWSSVAAKIELDRVESNAEKDRVLHFLTTVTKDLSTTRDRMAMLRGEIDKQKRHLEGAVKRFGEFHLKPETEQICDDPLLEMKKQCDATRTILDSLEISRSNCKDQEVKLASFEKELRRAVEKSSRSVFLHQDEVIGQQRRAPAPLSNPTTP